MTAERSSFAGPHPVQNIQRWDEANKTYVEVEAFHCGYVQQVHVMGGMDLLDSFTAKYKFPMKSRRWYVYIFWHTIILAVINAWLLYKRDCRALKMAKQEILKRRLLQADLASSLILVNTTPMKTPKRGRLSSGNGSPAATVTSRSPLIAQKRPSSGDGSPPNRAPSKRSQPPLAVRKDLVAHFPGKTKRGCSRHCSKGYTNTQCTKYDVRLCFSDDRNRFLDYHIQ
ncbi:uncharacterized protein LOC117554886 [Gymnodraco acuticeps]|uniref:Uncharacterized protein LOC117554886 n=1 Tax=Gymnodraco acuticeps TaxID=8218 RepID=A0A6P8WCZ2_GYMAC|nr:uncharacterized protein LOC117554886 [Gymnodraco acuticeps]XP_034085348.1 uncharacterized protein LOC117554886 [Gymnodraco acuticeps]